MYEPLAFGVKLSLAIGASPESVAERSAWCQANCRGQWRRGQSGYDGYSYDDPRITVTWFFTNETDAVLFKLTWAGAADG